MFSNRALTHGSPYPPDDGFKTEPRFILRPEFNLFLRILLSEFS